MYLKQNSKTQKPTQATKTTTSPTNISHQSAWKATKSPNQNEEDFKPANQLSGEGNNDTNSSNESIVQSEPTNQMLHEKDELIKPSNQNELDVQPTNQMTEETQNNSKVPNQDQLEARPTEMPFEYKFKSSTPPTGYTEEVNVTDKNSDVKSARSLRKVADMEDEAANTSNKDEDKSEKNINLLSSPLTDLDTMVNDQGVFVDNVEDAIITDEDSKLAKESLQER